MLLEDDAARDPRPTHGLGARLCPLTEDDADGIISDTNRITSKLNLHRKTPALYVMTHDCLTLQTGDYQLRYHSVTERWATPLCHRVPLFTGVSFLIASLYERMVFKLLCHREMNMGVFAFEASLFVSQDCENNTLSTNSLTIEQKSYTTSYL